MDMKEAYPALVQKLYTEVMHGTDPLYRDPLDAVQAQSGAVRL